MRSFTHVIALIGALISISCGTREKPHPTKIEFQNDYQAAKELALETGKPMIIDFYTSWTRWCDSLDANTYSDSLVIGMSVDNIFVKINAEVDTALADEFGVSGFPTIVITKPDGEEIDRMWGYFPPTDFYNQVQLYLQGKETLDDYLTRLEDEPENLEYLSMVGEKYASRSRFEEAIGYYGKIIELDPENTEGYAARAMAAVHDVRARSKNYAGAIAACKELAERFPDTEEADEAVALIGYYTAKMGDKMAALRYYRDYLRKHPDGENAEWVKSRVEDLEAEI